MVQLIGDLDYINATKSLKLAGVILGINNEQELKMKVGIWFN